MRRLLSKVLSLLCGAALLLSQPATVWALGLPTLGDAGEMSLAAERRLGEQIMRELYRDSDYLDDAILLDYVESTWKPLLDAARRRGELPDDMDQRFAWEVLLGRDREVNAFALPGGYMGVYLGLLSLVTSRDELASVLGHETSHITQRHISRSMAKEAREMPLMMAAMILGLIAASRSPDMAGAVIIGGQAGMIQSQLNYSRDMEREADRVGYGVMTDAGFDGRGFVTMFDKLQLASRHNDSGGFPYLRSHPLTTERIADMQSRFELRGLPPMQAVYPATLEHAIISARARALATRAPDQQREWLRDPQRSDFKNESVVKQVTGLTTGLLTALAVRDFPLAKAWTERLGELVAKDAPAQRLQALLAAEVGLAASDPRAALNLTVSAQGPRPELFLGTQGRLMAYQQNPAAPTGDALTQAAGEMRTWVALHPRDGGAWSLLSRVNQAQGFTLRALRDEAEVQVAHFDYQGALDRFRAAQNWGREHPEGTQGPADSTHQVDASIVDTRAREVTLLLREQAAQR